MSRNHSSSPLFLIPPPLLLAIVSVALARSLLKLQKLRLRESSTTKSAVPSMYARPLNSRRWAQTRANLRVRTRKLGNVS